MNRFLFLLILLSLFSCSRTEKQQEPVKNENGSGSTISGQEQQISQNPDKPGSARGIGPGASAGANAAAPPSADSKNPAPAQTARNIQGGIENLLLNSGGAEVYALDFDFGPVAQISKDERYVIAQSFIKEIWMGKNTPEKIHPDFRIILDEIIQTARDGESFNRFRIGELRQRGGGYNIPFRVFNDSQTATGYLVLTSKNGSWYVQDLIFNAENIHDITEEAFSPSLYRWMEVY